MFSQFRQVLEVIHPNRPSVPRAELATLLAKNFKSTPDCVISFGFQVAFGGGKVRMAIVVETGLTAARRRSASR